MATASPPDQQSGTFAGNLSCLHSATVKNKKEYIFKFHLSCLHSATVKNKRVNFLTISAPQKKAKVKGLGRNISYLV